LNSSGITVAVVGGGIFGVTAAVELAGAGFAVSLYEKAPDLLQGASGINQYRLHRGYHYPRSVSTAIESRESEASFVDRYGESVVNGPRHYYCVAREGSRTSPEAFLAFCHEVGLEAQEVELPIVRSDMVGLTIEARESLFDPFRLRDLCWAALKANTVQVYLNTTASAETLQGFDFSVVAAYANINELLGDHPEAIETYQYEVCEKPVVRLPSSFNGMSVVIMDGPFMCADPLGDTGLFVLGNVVHAIHGTNDGIAAEFDPEIAPLLDRGIVKHPPITRFPEFIESGSEFMPGFAEAEHVGSMYTVRTVLPRRDATDERPTLVRKVGDGVYTIFSGKVGTCVAAAREVRDAIVQEAGVDTSAAAG
jgi:glycine/D-amino acid oxidase-like deaminating enzyme